MMSTASLDGESHHPKAIQDNTWLPSPFSCPGSTRDNKKRKLVVVSQGKNGKGYLAKPREPENGDPSRSRVVGREISGVLRLQVPRECHIIPFPKCKLVAGQVAQVASGLSCRCEKLGLIHGTAM